MNTLYNFIFLCICINELYNHYKKGGSFKLSGDTSKKHKQYRLLGSFKLSGGSPHKCGKYYNPDKALLIGKKAPKTKMKF